jgi:hypothetical protein
MAHYTEPRQYNSSVLILSGRQAKGRAIEIWPKERELILLCWPFNLCSNNYGNVTGKRNAQASEMRTFAKTYLYT